MDTAEKFTKTYGGKPRISLPKEGQMFEDYDAKQSQNWTNFVEKHLITLDVVKKKKANITYP